MNENEIRLTTVNIIPDSTIQLVRDLCEGKLTHDPSRERLSRIAKPKPIHRRHSPFIFNNDKFIVGERLIHIATMGEVIIVDRNIWGKYLLRWPDKNITEASESDLMISFTRPNPISATQSKRTTSN